jgi:hypothetical protein
VSLNNVEANVHSHSATPNDISRQLAAPHTCSKELTAHSKNRVGMAGFEPAASCSQISSIRTRDVAYRNVLGRSTTAQPSDAVLAGRAQCTAQNGGSVTSWSALGV